MLQRLDVKLVLAAVSGALVWFVVMTPGLTVLGLDEGPSWEPLKVLYFYGLSGALFAVSILWVYLRRDDHFLPRGMALVAASVLSFLCAVNVGLSIPEVANIPKWISTEDMAGSIVGAIIVFTAARYIVPFNWSTRYVLSGVLAAIVGGWAFDALAYEQGADRLRAFIAWHCIVCAGLHFGTRQSEESVHA